MRRDEAKRARRKARIAARTPEKEQARQDYWERVRVRGGTNWNRMFVIATNPLPARAE